jgi:hypothetical protein
MARLTSPTVCSGTLLQLEDPHLKLWTNLYDFMRGSYYSAPLILALAWVIKTGF